jgi:hypothetical protein
VSWKIKSGRQNGDRYLCATSADKANQESDKERNRGELVDDHNDSVSGTPSWGDRATLESPGSRIGHTFMHDRASFNRVGRPNVAGFGGRPQPRRDVPAPGQENENYRDDHQSQHRNANEREDEPGEEPSDKDTEKNARQESVASPQEAPSLGSAHAITSIPSDPQIARVHCFEPPCMIDRPQSTALEREYPSHFVFARKSHHRAIQRSTVRSGFTSGILRRA